MTMVYGEDHAKAINADATARMAASASGSFQNRGNGLGTEAPLPSFSSVGECAAAIRGMGYERRETVRHLADRASGLVARLGGTFPSPLAGKDPNGAFPEPRSAIEAALREVSSIGDPLRQMDEGLLTLSTSLDALERALS